MSYPVSRREGVGQKSGMDDSWDEIDDLLSDDPHAVPPLALSAGIAFVSLATLLGTVTLSELIRVARLGARWGQ